MSASTRTSTGRAGRQLAAAVRAMAVATLLLGIGYPLVTTGVAQLVAPARADGSLVEVDGEIVGSALLGQAFTDAGGAPLPQYFQSRPSAGDHDPLASGGSNLGPESEELIASIEERRAAVAELEGVDPADVPADAVTASASGLDPGISPEYAALQVPRVAAERGVPVARVEELVAGATVGRDLAVIGDPYVHVLRLNLALDRELG